MKRPKNSVSVAVVEIDKAEARYLEVCRNKTREAFWVFVGAGILWKRYNFNYDAFYLTPEEAQKIALLTGPHWYTVLKAYEAQQCRDQ